MSEPGAVSELIEVAAVVIEHVLNRLPEECREAALAKTAEREAARRARIEQTGGLVFMDLSDEGFEAVKASPEWRYANAIARFKACIAYNFLRTIVNNRSAKDAERLLFDTQHAGAGSGQLADYLERFAKRLSRHSTAMRSA